MRRAYIFSIVIISTLIFTGCISLSNPFSHRSNIEIKEGVLSLKTVNINLSKQMPTKVKVGSNSINIVSTTVFAGADGKYFLTEVEFIFTSFEIPEGLPAVARFSSSMEYNPKLREFKLSRISQPEIKFLKESLLEYITPQQKKFIPDTLMLKLYSLVLHKSKKRLGSIKSFKVKEGVIKVTFR